MAGGSAVLPAPEKGWVRYGGGAEAASGELAAVAGLRGDAVIGLPAARLSTFAVTLPATDPALHESMIFAQVEKRGLAGRSDDGAMVDFVRIGPGENGEHFAVTVAAEPEEGLVFPGAAGYATSAGLRAPPPAGARLWREQGRWVFAIYAGEHPAHVQVLAHPAELDVSVAKEINLLLLGLGGEAALEEHFPESVEVEVADSEAAVPAAFTEALSLPVTVRTGGPVVRERPAGRDRLTPAAVSRSRRRRRRNRGIAAALTAAFVVYLVTAVWLWGKADRTADEIESLERRIAILEPDVERVRRIEQRWERLAPAFDKQWYPVVQLSRLTSALPGSGVVVREYRTSGRDIRVRGQAGDVQLANRLLEDLQAMDFFSPYQWNMPNPKVEQDNTATFEIEGKPIHATTDG